MTGHAELLAEHAFLRARLEHLPPSASLTRASAEARLRAVEDGLRHTPAADRRRSPVVRLTLKGRPVVGRDGIQAGFGARAVGAFADAVAAVAASVGTTLASWGPIPDRDAHQLLITGVAAGSFGFELQEASVPSADRSQATPVEKALTHLQRLLRASTMGDDEGLADLAAELDRHAIDQIRAFVHLLEESEAVCSLEYGEQLFRFMDIEQVRTSLGRLSRENLQEMTVTLDGVFDGMLPHLRTFEFRRADTGEVIAGKVAPAILFPGFVNDHLQQEVRAEFLQTVVGRGTPRYLLVGLPDAWLAQRIAGR